MAKRIFCLLIAVFLCAGFTGCSSEPIYYSEDQVVQYVNEIFGEDYKLTDKNSYEDDSDEKNLQYEYTFTNSKGEAFTALTYTTREMVNGSLLNFYEKNITDNYRLSALNRNRNEIVSACKEKGIKVDFEKGKKVNFEKESYACKDICLYIDGLDRFEDAGQLISEIDEILSMEYDYNNTKVVLRSNHSIAVNVYFNSDVNDENTNDYFLFTSVSLSHNKSQRLVASEVYKRVECEFVDYVKRNGNIDIPEELWFKYPAPAISISSVNNIKFDDKYNSISFMRYGMTSTYYLVNLFPCDKGKEGMPNAFSYMVECLGGQYKCTHSVAEWTIDDITWKAWYDKNSNTSDGFSVKRNGKKLILSEVGDGYGRVSSSGKRGFTPGDLKKLLNAEVIIDQKTRQAEIIKK